MLLIVLIIILLLAFGGGGGSCSEVQSMLTLKLGDVREKIHNLSRLEEELANALRNCSRELRLNPEIKHQDCCPLLTKLNRINGPNGNKYGSYRGKPRNK